MLEELKKALAEKRTGLVDLEKAAFADDATEEATKALNDALDEVEKLKAKVKQAERVEAETKANAAPASTPVDEPHKTPAKSIEKMGALEKVGLGIVGLMKSNAEGKGRHWNAVADTMDKMGYGAVAEELDARNKAMNTGTDSAGGFAVAEDFNEQIFDELRPYASFLRGEPDMMPMPNGNYRQSGAATRPTVGYRTEGGVIAASEPTLREIDMSAKLLSGIIPMTNQIVNWTGERASNKAKQLLSVAMGLTMDTAAYESTGASNTPLGLFNVSGITTFAASGATTPTVAEIDSDARKLINVMESYAGLQLGLSWVMPQRVIGYLQDLRDGNNNLVYPSMQGDNPSFKGYRVLKTGTISVAGGVGTDETTIALVSFGNILFGESGGLNIRLSDEATYDSGGGAMVSAFANDLTLIRATMEHDWQPKYDEAVGTLTACRWGG